MPHTITTPHHTTPPPPPSGATPYEILLSYVHKEAVDEAVALRLALVKTGYRVFLDMECIQSGSDWQDSLNDAVSNCTLFIPLITEQYGQVKGDDRITSLIRTPHLTNQDTFFPILEWFHSNFLTPYLSPQCV